jgi:multidrug efflux pump subunit AcrB
MKIAEFSVKNYQFTLIIFMLLVALGLNSLFNMPRGEDPETKAPSFSIVVVYPGTSPTDMEKLVLEPFEKRLNELDDVKKLISEVNDGLATIRIEYKHELDAEDKYQEIVREVNAMQNELPADIFAIKIFKFTSTDVNVFQTAIISESASYSDLEIQVEKI